MNRFLAKFVYRLLVWALVFIPGLSSAVTDVCPPFYLRDDTGAVINPVTGENANLPYSTRKTCGACHDVETISRGYHFMMDWDKADDHRFKDTDTPWLVSTGLTGGMTPYGYYFLAKKENSHPDEIDLSVFDFISRAPEKTKGFQKPGCAACHPGGGMLEKDRDDLRYDHRLKDNPQLAQSLDGDYYKSLWDKTGVIEPDCFICHSSRYSIQSRIVQMKDLNFKWATVAASGIGQVRGKVIEGDIPKVTYNRRLFNADGRFIMPEMVFKPAAKNCLICHESIELGKRGFSWDDPENPDVHQWTGLTCIDCHFGDINHNFAKGNAMANGVAPEFNHTMRSCRQCHETGHKGAAPMKHAGIRQDHLDRLTCQACHIPELSRSAVGAMYVGTGRFGKIGQAGTNRFGELKPWKPALVQRKQDRDGKLRLTPVNPFYASLFTNKSPQGIYEPLYLSEMEKAYHAVEKQLSKRSNPNDFHNPKDLEILLKSLSRSLKGNPRFQAVHPVFHDGGFIFELDETGVLVQSRDNTWVSRIPHFSVNHNVAPKERALGANGCRDCHSGDSHIFNGRVVTRFFGKDGTPETISMAQFAGIPGTVQIWNFIFGAYLNMVPWLFVTAVVLCSLALIRGLVADVPGINHKLPVQVFAFFLTLWAAHLLQRKELNFLGEWLDVPGAKELIIFILMLLAAALFYRLIRELVFGGWMKIAVFIAALLILTTGIIMYTGIVMGLKNHFFVWTTHVVTGTVLMILLPVVWIIRDGRKQKVEEGI